MESTAAVVGPPRYHYSIAEEEGAIEQPRAEPMVAGLMDQTIFFKNFCYLLFLFSKFELHLCANTLPVIVSYNVERRHEHADCHRRG